MRQHWPAPPAQGILLACEEKPAAMKLNDSNVVSEVKIPQHGLPSDFKSEEKQNFDLWSLFQLPEFQTGDFSSGRSALSIRTTPSTVSRDARSGLCNKTHLVVLVHGLGGDYSDWEVVYEQAMNCDELDHMLFYVSIANEKTRTRRGIDVCGDALVEEVQRVCARSRTLTKISFVGHSLGGLISRYAIGRMFDPGSGTILGLAPAHFVTMATPHLGCDGGGITQVPLLGWAREVPLIGGSVQRAMAQVAAPVSEMLYGRTGQQLWLQDAAEGSDAGRPLIERMASWDPEDGHFLRSLAAFSSRTAYANVSGDHLVGWANSSLRSGSQLPPVDSLRGLVNIIEADDPARPAGDFPAPDDASPTGSRGPAPLLERRESRVSAMLANLQELPWRRVDVWIKDPFSHFMAHNHIQVTSKWINGVGQPIVRHLTSLLGSLERRAGADDPRAAAAKEA
uniref:Alpha beta-hydrolases superfamily protein n=1 Tax=Tetraselmis sp. GSL018 TaxID=582737 RepID=A0A061RZM0_9CHLO